MARTSALLLHWLLRLLEAASATTAAAAVLLPLAYAGLSMVLRNARTFSR